MRLVPVDNKRGDWPRLVADGINQLRRNFETATDWGALQNFADDTAAAAGGIEIGQLYRNGSQVMVRVA